MPSGELRGRRARGSRFIMYVFALAALGLVLGGIGWGLRTIRASDANSPLNSPIFGAAVPLPPEWPPS